MKMNKNLKSNNLSNNLIMKKHSLLFFKLSGAGIRETRNQQTKTSRLALKSIMVKWMHRPMRRVNSFTDQQIIMCCVNALRHNELPPHTFFCRHRCQTFHGQRSHPHPATWTLFSSGSEEGRVSHAFSGSNARLLINNAFRFRLQPDKVMRL